MTRLFGELAVIVAGVLLALWADGWVEGRTERRIEASRIEALRDNVAATRERLGHAVGEAESAARALRAVAGWESVPELDGESEDVLLEALLFGPEFTPEVNVYVDLKSSGELGLLRSAALRQALAKMDATLEQLQLVQQDLITVQQINFDRYVLETLALDRGFAEYLELEEVPKSTITAPRDLRILRNLALFKLDLVSQLIRRMAETGLALDEVDEALEESHTRSAVAAI